jgi:hypothetical protein
MFTAGFSPEPVSKSHRAYALLLKGETGALMLNGYFTV